MADRNLKMIVMKQIIVLVVPLALAALGATVGIISGMLLYKRIELAYPSTRIDTLLLVAAIATVGGGPIGSSLGALIGYLIGLRITRQ